MKKFIWSVIFAMCFVASYGQEEEVKPIKFASWTISKAFQAEAGFTGSYWKPTFNIAKDEFGYYCVVNLYTSDTWYTINNEITPHLYLKKTDGSVVELLLDGDEPVHKFSLAGYYVGNVWMPKRYVTRLIYTIPDENDFFSNSYIKYRVWIGETYKDVELRQNYAKKFNTRLQTAYSEVTKRYDKKTSSLNNPLDGF